MLTREEREKILSQIVEGASKKRKTSESKNSQEINRVLKPFKVKISPKYAEAIGDKIVDFVEEYKGELNKYLSTLPVKQEKRGELLAYLLGTKKLSFDDVIERLKTVNKIIKALKPKSIEIQGSFITVGSKNYYLEYNTISDDYQFGVMTSRTSWIDIIDVEGLLDRLPIIKDFLKAKNPEKCRELIKKYKLRKIAENSTTKVWRITKDIGVYIKNEEECGFADISTIKGNKTTLLKRLHSIDRDTIKLLTNMVKVIEKIFE